MRKILSGDLSAAARAVASLPAQDQPAMLSVLFDLAHAADLYRKRTGRIHPAWGNGTLYAAALPAGHALPAAADLRDVPYLQAYGRAVAALIAWRLRGRSGLSGG